MQSWERRPLAGEFFGVNGGASHTLLRRGSHLRLAARGWRGFNPVVRPFIQEISTAQTPESLIERLAGARGMVLLRSAGFDSPQARYSFVAANPFLTFRSFGSRCEVASFGSQLSTPDSQLQYGNP